MGILHQQLYSPWSPIGPYWTLYMYYVYDSSIAGQLGVLPTATELLDHQVNQFVEAGSADQQPPPLPVAQTSAHSRLEDYSGHSQQQSDLLTLSLELAMNNHTTKMAEQSLNSTVSIEEGLPELGSLLLKSN